MKMNFRKRSLSFFLCLMLIVAMALTTAGCNDKTSKTVESTAEASQQTGEEAMQAETAVQTGEETVQSDAEDAVKEDVQTQDVQVLGEGNTIFPLSVVDGEGQETLFEIHTDKATVGEALLELGVISGDEGEFGLYVKTVNGITADYDVDQTYWALYINDEYAMTGIDQTRIAEGDSYSLRVEK